MVLGIMDGLSGLEKVFSAKFPGARVQRCQVHVVCNVLAKAPKKSKERVANDMPGQINCFLSDV
jgi:putative transposase